MAGDDKHADDDKKALTPFATEFLDLPDEIQALIFGMLELRSLFVMAQTNHHLRQIVLDSIFFMLPSFKLQQYQFQWLMNYLYQVNNLPSLSNEDLKAIEYRLYENMLKRQFTLTSPALKALYQIYMKRYRLKNHIHNPTLEHANALQALFFQIEELQSLPQGLRREILGGEFPQPDSSDNFSQALRLIIFERDLNEQQKQAVINYFVAYEHNPSFESEISMVAKDTEDLPWLLYSLRDNPLWVRILSNISENTALRLINYSRRENYLDTFYEEIETPSSRYMDMKCRKEAIYAIVDAQIKKSLNDNEGILEHVEKVLRMLAQWLGDVGDDVESSEQISQRTGEEQRIRSIVEAMVMSVSAEDLGSEISDDNLPGQKLGPLLAPKLEVYLNYIRRIPKADGVQKMIVDALFSGLMKNAANIKKIKALLLAEQDIDQSCKKYTAIIARDNAFSPLVVSIVARVIFPYLDDKQKDQFMDVCAETDGLMSRTEFGVENDEPSNNLIAANRRAWLSVITDMSLIVYLRVNPTPERMFKYLMMFRYALKRLVCDVPASRMPLPRFHYVSFDVLELPADDFVISYKLFLDYFKRNNEDYGNYLIFYEILTNALVDMFQKRLENSKSIRAISFMVFMSNNIKKIMEKSFDSRNVDELIGMVEKSFPAISNYMKTFALKPGPRLGPQLVRKVISSSDFYEAVQSENIRQIIFGTLPYMSLPEKNEVIAQLKQLDNLNFSRLLAYLWLAYKDMISISELCEALSVLNAVPVSLAPENINTNFMHAIIGAYGLLLKKSMNQQVMDILTEARDSFMLNVVERVGRWVAADVADRLDFKRLKFTPNSNYWYHEFDIHQLLTTAIGDTVYVDAAQHPLEADGDAERFQRNNELFQQAIIGAMATNATRVMPINTTTEAYVVGEMAGRHWVGMMIRPDRDARQVEVVLVDPLGNGLDHDVNFGVDNPEELRPDLRAIAGLAWDAIAGDFPDYMINFTIRHEVQQTNDYDCGPLTVDNLVNLALNRPLETDPAAAQVLRRRQGDVLFPAQADITTVGMFKPEQRREAEEAGEAVDDENTLKPG